ncbi:olfactory receptor 10G4-like [Lepisosteus oculatus]|uniref:olfactory receptor 10G4-like n=1 Tax=Lepisosteus oculatus TaxID=7918 RepID=UPI00371E7041
MALMNDTGQGITEFVITGFNSVENPKPVGYVILITYSLILVANSTIICIIAMDKRLHSPMYFFICNLAFVDILYSTSVSPTMIMILIADEKRISTKLCISQMYVNHLMLAMEAFAISLMAYDRWVAISIPLRYNSILTKNKVITLTAASWMLGAALFGILAGIASNLPYCYTFLKYAFCDYGALVRAACVNPDDYFVVSTTIVFFVLFAPFAFIIFSYYKIIYSVMKISSKTNRKKMFSTCFSHLIVAACFYTPQFVAIILTRGALVLTLTQRNILFIGANLGPSLVNPFVYCLRTKEIRKQVFRIPVLKSIAPSE